MAAFVVHRFKFFGRETISFIFVLPIALPGIITGMALNSFIAFNGVNFSLVTIVIGHATFCIVVVYNNVLARLRRTQTSLVEASMDLGADGPTTFRLVTLPTIATSLVAGGLLAFALSFDEIVVTEFTAGAQNTLPIWIFGNIRLGQQLPQVNVVVLMVIAMTLIPVTLAQRLTRDTGVLRGTPGPAAYEGACLSAPWGASSSRARSASSAARSRRACARQGVEVRGVDARAEPALGVIAGDVSERRAHGRPTPQAATRVIHTAAIVSLRSGLQDFHRVNVRRHAERARGGDRGRREPLRAALLGDGVRQRLPRRGRRGPPRQAARRALRGHQDRRRAGRAAGPRRGRDGGDA